MIVDNPAEFLKSFKYPWEYDIDLPKLVLAIDVSEGYPIEYKFNPPYDFKKIVHQTSGNACHQHYMYGLILNPVKELAEYLIEIDDRYFETCMGMFRSPYLDDLVEYDKGLYREFGLHCQASYRDFEEGIYSIDIMSGDDINRLLIDKLPEDLDELISFDSETDRICGCIGRWSLYILGRNCD